ncbi:MAG TPA: PPK2 family polyphosphate kinase [Pyrinomonadaceae bacterium]|jgi:PPK2 family polyphosphate:nucleotide phosphotransferase|nr:PPK2 family polyphosphate kinase [Pyrinomonadaceae bacterium]
MVKQNDFIVRPGSRPRLKNYDTAFTGAFTGEHEAGEKIEADCAELARLQDRLMATESHALLVILQAMDGSGKDGTIKHVASVLDPQGCTAHNFKKPSETENRHDYLWRFHKHVPERGRITFFNRSYYEEVISTRVHPERVEKQKLPSAIKTKDIWKRRMTEINNFEQYLTDNGVRIVKFFLHLSKEKQVERLLERTRLPEKKWKFSSSDIWERSHWDKNMKAYEDVLSNTSTEAAPWHVIPADNRWFTSAAVSSVIVSTLKSLHLRYPTMSKEQREEMAKTQKILERDAGL